MMLLLLMSCRVVNLNPSCVVPGSFTCISDFDTSPSASLEESAFETALDAALEEPFFFGEVDFLPPLFSVSLDLVLIDFVDFLLSFSLDFDLDFAFIYI